MPTAWGYLGDNRTAEDYRGPSWCAARRAEKSMPGRSAGDLLVKGHPERRRSRRLFLQPAGTAPQCRAESSARTAPGWGGALLPAAAGWCASTSTGRLRSWMWLKQAVPDDPVVRVLVDLMSADAIGSGDPIRAADMLVIAEQINAAIGKRPIVVA